MKPKSLAVAAVCAVALIGVGLAVQELRQPPQAAAQAGSRLYPKLLDEVNQVVAIDVRTPEGAYRIARKDGTWGLEQKGGYPVDAGQVSKTLIALAELETVEPKTSDPARYADIGVEDPGGEGAQSKLVTLEGEGGAQLASLIVGERRAGRGTPSFYVRKAGEAGSWLVSGDLDLRADGLGWLDKKILELERGQVRAVETVQPDGASVLVSKADRDAPNFQVHDMPAERELKYETVANGMGSALEYLNLQDVVPASEFEAPEAEPVRTSFWTFEGMRVDVEVLDKDGKAYARFRASYEPDGPARLAAAVGPTPPPAEEGAGEDEAGETEEVVAEVTRPAEEVKREAEALDARLSNWVFEIPVYNKTNLTKRLEDLLAEPVVEESVEDEDGFEDDLFAPDETAAPIDEAAEPPAEEPGVEDPPVSDEPVVEDPPAGDEPVVEDPPAGDEPVVEDPPVSDEPVVEDPPAGDEPVVEDPPVGDEPTPADPPAGGGDGR